MQKPRFANRSPAGSVPENGQSRAWFSHSAYKRALPARRFFLLLTPQLVVSAFVVIIYSRNLDLNFPGIRLAFHAGEIIAFESVFFLGWGAIASTSWGKRSREAPLLFAASLVVVLGVLNLIYIAQLLSARILASPLDTDSLRGFVPQLRSLAAAVGPLPYCICVLLGLCWLGCLGFACARAHTLWRHLQLAVPTRGSSLWGLASVIGIFAIFVCFGLHLAGRNDRLSAGLSSDPLLSLWLTSSVARQATPELGADILARRNYPPGPVQARRTVILITIDALRPDHLSVYGYARKTTPFLEEMTAAGRLLKVDCAYAVSNASRNGLLGLLASRYPDGIHLGNFLLPEVLQRAGYRTHAFLSGDHTTFQHLRRSYGDHFTTLRDGNEGAFPTNDDRNVVAAVEHLPASDGQPSFFWLHLMSAHSLGVRLPELANWSQTQGAGWEARFWGQEAGQQNAVDSYDDGVLQADLYLRRIFAAFQAKGYLENYFAVITADHGESLGEHGVFGHWQTLFEPEVRVPVLFGGSGDFARPTVPFGRQVDIAPTILGWLDLPVPSSWQGHSLLDYDPTAPVTTQTYLVSTPPGTWRAVVDTVNGIRFKYLFDAHDSLRVPEQLFNLSADPGETRDLVATAPATVLLHLRQLAAAHFRLSVNTASFYPVGRAPNH